MSEFDVVYVSIGNSDDKLTQSEWARFWTETDTAIRMHADSIFGSWLSEPHSPWQNACWAFKPKVSSVFALRRRLGWLAMRYGQESIAWAQALTEFLRGLPPEPFVDPGALGDPVQDRQGGSSVPS